MFQSDLFRSCCTDPPRRAAPTSTPAVKIGAGAGPVKRGRKQTEKYPQQPFNTLRIEDYHSNHMAFTLEQLDHLVLTVANIDATVDFYTEALGMDLIASEGHKALTFGMQQINLQQRGHESNPKAAHPTPGSSDLCFITATPLKDVIEYLTSQRVHLEEGPVERAGTLGKILSVYLRDPDRNLIEISNYL